MVVVFVLIMFSSVFGFLQGQLQVGFYADTCPNAESIVREIVQSKPNLASVLLRLHFHDCFVQGCDGSILIDNGADSERHAFGHQGVGGFDLIEKAKAQLESECPGVVSCADIVAMAARDAIAMTNGPNYEVQTGRRDGMVSNVASADNMPDIGDSIEQLKAKFRDKGLSDKDLVLLTASHTIGTTACFFMTDRLYNSPNGGTDPTINPSLIPELKAKCPRNGDVNVRLPMDRGSEQTFDDQILQNIRNGFAVLQSDAKLYEDDDTKGVIDSYFDTVNPVFGPNFEEDYVNSMVKMGSIDVKTGSEGTIRRVCGSFN